MGRMKDEVMRIACCVKGRRVIEDHSAAFD